uniref:HSPB1-associated protein 1 n=1 Tax=Myxine glutinosa TaxID=7769 RepID=UPI00358F0BC7
MTVQYAVNLQAYSTLLICARTVCLCLFLQPFENVRGVCFVLYISITNYVRKSELLFLWSESHLNTYGTVMAEAESETASRTNPSKLEPSEWRPFLPLEARELLSRLEHPAVFRGMATTWPALGWTLQRLSEVTGEQRLQFRLGRMRPEKSPQFETDCRYILATLHQFAQWCAGDHGEAVGPFLDFDPADTWAYADYKYLAVLFAGNHQFLQGLMWSDFGYFGRDGRQSTLWIGSDGAGTPCHQDTYGCNLVLQIQGRKRWTLFPPEDAQFLYPTRLPYEESSVFSRVDVTQPDLAGFPCFCAAHPHVVTLNPGEVLFVPPKWWHDVECLDPINVSSNSWIELSSDKEARVEEALTRTLVCLLKSQDHQDNTDCWLNPTEDEDVTYKTNLRFLNLAILGCGQSEPSDIPNWPNPSHRQQMASTANCHGNPQRSHLCSQSPKPIPYGPNLLPVLPLALSPEFSTGTEEGVCTEKARKIARVEGNRGSKREELEDRSTGGKLMIDDINRQGGGYDQVVVTTNELLDCLVRPEVVALVARHLRESVVARDTIRRLGETPLS